MALPHISDDERRARLALRHRLLPTMRTDDVADITNDLVALHSSDPATVFLSAGARMAHPSIEAIETALYDDRCALRHHAMRRTLWVMAPLTAARAHASSSRKVASAERRRLLRMLAATPGIDRAESWLEDALVEVEAAVKEATSITTRELGERLPHLRVSLPYPGPRDTTVGIVAHTKVVQLAAFEGRVARTRPTGTWISSQYQWAPMTDWHPGGVDTLETPVAAAALLAQWLERFGPGTDADLQWWTGWTKTAVANALAELGAQEVALDHGDRAWVAPGDEGPVNADALEPWVALLPGLDPTAMGWRDREWYLDDEVASRVFDRNGNAGPTVWIDGRIVGGWAQLDDGSISLELLRPLTHRQRAALDDEMQRSIDFVGPTRVSVRFKSPSYRELRAG